MARVGRGLQGEPEPRRHRSVTQVEPAAPPPLRASVVVSIVCADEPRAATFGHRSTPRETTVNFNLGGSVAGGSSPFQHMGETRMVMRVSAFQKTFDHARSRHLSAAKCTSGYNSSQSAGASDPLVVCTSVHQTIPDRWEPRSRSVVGSRGGGGPFWPAPTALSALAVVTTGYLRATARHTVQAWLRQRHLASRPSRRAGRRVSCRGRPGFVRRCFAPPRSSRDPGC